ncbi:hypothetical protein [Butyrivibrio sp. VCB2006]|uniref:hypothetical protein n=1 Tax=Butyrivibrio sp. VCB2006 TaxID=1280679 RepID=UPI0003FD14A1|nr:hypothetical protein [Butyrivibrio sp. VCB2006]
MNKNAKRALICGGIFLIQLAVLAGVSIAHDNGAFETWYRSVFRHPRLIAVACGTVMAALLMLLCRPEEPMDIGYALTPVFLGNLLINGIISRMHGTGAEESYYGTDLGFWADRLLYIFNNMIVVVIVLLALFMYIQKGVVRDAKRGEQPKAKDKEERVKVILAGMLCSTFLWAISMSDLMDSFMNSFFDMFDPNNNWSEFTSLIICGVILDLFPYLCIKIFRVIESRKQLLIFAASSFLTNILIYEVVERIFWWDGADDGFGFGILCGVLSFALVFLYVIIMVDPMSRRAKAEVA